MKIDDLSNYQLKLTEKYSRYYHSSEPTLERTEVRVYDLNNNEEIYTSCGFLEISGFLKSEDDITGIYINYIDPNLKRQTCNVTLNTPSTIRLMEGEGTIYRISDCTFEIVKKED